MQARLVYSDGQGKEANRTLDAVRSVVIGRGLEADIVLVDPSVAKSHARVGHDPATARFVLEDLGGGTLVNEEPAVGKRPLEHGDVIRCGDARLTYVEVAGKPAVRIAPDAPTVRRSGPEAIAAVAAGAPMTVCGSCGAIVASNKPACTVCGTTYTTRHQVPRRTDGLLLALASDVSFQCRACGLRSPFPGLELGEEVTCRRCGVSQAFDVKQWKDCLGFAHAVVDLFASPPPRLSPPPPSDDDEDDDAMEHVGDLKQILGILDQVGVEGCGLKKELSTTILSGGGMTTHTLHLKASPGHPLCPGCHVPVEVAVDKSGGVVSTCGQCGEVSSFERPAGAAKVAHALAGVLSEAHRRDRPLAREAAGATAVALECPKCNASLPLQADMTFVRCEYCGTTARIPDRLVRLKDARPVPFWLVFRGPSDARKHLESVAKKDGARKDESRRREIEAGKEERLRNLRDQEVAGRDRGRLWMLIAFVAVMILGGIAAVAMIK